MGALQSGPVKRRQPAARPSQQGGVILCLAAQVQKRVALGKAHQIGLLARLRRKNLRHAKAGHAVECITGRLMGRKHRGEPVGIPRTGHVFEHDRAPVTPVIALHDLALFAVILDPLGPAGTGFRRNPRLSR